MYRLRLLKVSDFLEHALVTAPTPIATDALVQIMKLPCTTIGAREGATPLCHHVNHAVDFRQHISRHSGQCVDRFHGGRNRGSCPPLAQILGMCWGRLCGFFSSSRIRSNKASSPSPKHTKSTPGVASTRSGANVGCRPPVMMGIEHCFRMAPITSLARSHWRVVREQPIRSGCSFRTCFTTSSSFDREEWTTGTPCNHFGATSRRYMPGQWTRATNLVQLGFQEIACAWFEYGLRDMRGKRLGLKVVPGVGDNR